MTTFGHLEDTDIDIAIDDRDAGERRGMELAARIRMVAAQDPELAQDLVEQLISALEKATGGTFRQFLDSDGESEITSEAPSVNSPARNS
ncbi:hypothetical protein [Actinoplanes sp. NPDC048796]|uniref:hypothetical protein n=1 Tax=unclassified Actinoplanes TaxID=2626549 RepID=UPI0033FE6B9B